MSMVLFALDDAKLRNWSLLNLLRKTVLALLWLLEQSFLQLALRKLCVFYCGQHSQLPIIRKTVHFSKGSLVF